MKAGAPPKDYYQKFIFEIYDLAKTGLSKKGIAESIGLEVGRLARWIEKYPLIAEAYNRGKKLSGQEADFTFKDYVYEQLPRKLQKLWDKIDGCQDNPNGFERIQTILAGTGVSIRKHLFLHALVVYNFNPSQALKALGMNRRTLDTWVEQDPDFGSLLDQLHWHKKNFLEGALMNKVRAGETSAILFANRTMNRDRGYNDKVEIEARVQHSHHITIDNLDLPLEVKMEVLEAYRKQQAIDVESTPALEDRTKELEDYSGDIDQEDDDRAHAVREAATVR